MRDSRQGFYAFVLFLIWPFLAAVSAFVNYRKGWAKNIFWLFCIFYGFTFSIGAESENSDIVRYVAELEELHAQQDISLERAIDYYRESGEIDIVRTVIAVTLSRFTGSQPYLTLVYAIIFGFFFSRNIWYVLERLKGRITLLTMLLLACFFLVNPIWNINGFRMWTAGHIFLYGLLPYLFEGKKNYLWVSIGSVFFHFAYIFPLAVLFGYMVMGNWLVLYFSFFMVTIFISEIDLTIINNLIESYAPEIFQERTASYRVEGDGVAGTPVAGGGDSRRWYAVWYGRALTYAVTGYLIMLFVTGRKFLYANRQWLNLFCYVLLFYGASNLIGSIGSGSRFITLGNLFALPLIILYMQNVQQEKLIKKYTYAALPALLLFFIVAARISLYTVSATSILGNPVVAFILFGDHMSLNDFLRMMIP